jgi:hypothetical protein
MSYVDDWNTAIVRSERFGLTVPPHQLEASRRWLDDKANADFPYVIRDGLGDLAFADVVGQCMMIHYRMAPVIEKWLHCPVLYTLGWIDDGTEDGLFRFDDDFIATKLRDGHSGSQINIHAWLTLPSMEVIDVALATTMGIVQQRPEMYGLAITRPADDLRGMAYKPMLIGDDFLRQSGLLVEWGIGEH